MAINPPRAILADDEPNLLAYLEEQLRLAWPALRVVGRAANGLEAARLIDDLTPDVAFLDIRMPGLTGLELAERMAGWEHRPHLVFITAYDEYAVRAFDHSAVDYLLKPPSQERIGQMVRKLQSTLGRAQGVPLDQLQQLLQQIAAPRGASADPGWLRWIRASQSSEVRLIDVDEVIYFQSNDKYTGVVTADGESLIRTPLGELSTQLDPTRFWQIHRGTVVAVRAIAGTRHDLRGRLVLRLKERPEELVVSRSYAGLFKPM